MFKCNELILTKFRLKWAIHVGLSENCMETVRMIIVCLNDTNNFPRNFVIQTAITVSHFDFLLMHVFYEFLLAKQRISPTIYVFL